MEAREIIKELAPECANQFDLVTQEELIKKFKDIINQELAKKNQKTVNQQKNKWASFAQEIMEDDRLRGYGKTLREDSQDFRENFFR